MRATHFLSFCLPAAALIGALPAIAAPAPAAIPAGRTDVPTQLPRDAVPIHHAIRAVPDAANMRFTATVAIDLAVTRPTRSLTLNAAELSFSSVRRVTAGGKAMTGQAIAAVRGRIATREGRLPELTAWMARGGLIPAPPYLNRLPNMPRIRLLPRLFAT